MDPLGQLNNFQVHSKRLLVGILWRVTVDSFWITSK